MIRPAGVPWPSISAAVVSSLAAALLLLLSATGCEETGEGSIDSAGLPPSLRSAALAPSTVNIDTLRPENGTTTVSTVITASVTDPDGRGSIGSVTARASRPSATSPFAETELRDDGVAPDAAAGDSLYTGTLRFAAGRADAGPYTVEVEARDNTGLAGNRLIRTLSLARSNSRPRLDSTSLAAPDTVVLPAGGSILVRLAIAANDSDGLADIRQVYFTNLASSNPTLPFQLLDDGGQQPPLYFQDVRSGDERAGDGVYSIQIPLVDGQAQRRTNRFSFKAVDSFGAVSDSLVHLLTVR